jgi:hypothetical protein
MMNSKTTKLANIVGRVFGKSVRRFFRRVGTGFLTPLSFSVNSGHFKSSLSEKALSKSGKAIPWFTYPAIDFLSTKDYSASIVLEFGGGQSTKFWGDLSKKVITFEVDENWIQHIKSNAGSNVEIFPAPVEREKQKEYVQRILLDLNEKFDIIVVDGMHRSLVLELSIPYLAADGMIICDNADAECFGFYEAWQDTSGFMRVDFYGHAPGVFHPHSTSVLFRPSCKFFDNKNKIYNRAYELNRMPYLNT